MNLLNSKVILWSSFPLERSSLVKIAIVCHLLLTGGFNAMASEVMAIEGDKIVAPRIILDEVVSQQIVLERVVTSEALEISRVQLSGCHDSKEIGSIACGFLKSKVIPGSVRYRLLHCVYREGCEPMGNLSGYTYSELKPLSGGWQRWAGASAVFLANVATAAGIPAFLILSPFGWTAAVVGLAAGGTAGATLPLLIPKDMVVVKHVNPRYHWEMGGLKSLLKTSAKFLERKESFSRALLFSMSTSSEQQDFQRKLDMLDGILDSMVKR